MNLKLTVPQWHYSMLLDNDRVAVFKEAINEAIKENDIVYDIGCGSGILGMIASQKAKKVYSIELDPITYMYCKENLKINKDYKSLNKIKLIEGDASEYNFPEKADLIIAELLDTALITEPQVPVLNKLLKKGYLKENGKIIPEKAHNSAQIVVSKMGHIYYDEEITSKEISNEIIYSTIDFYKVNKEEVSYNLEFNLNENINKNNLENKLLGIRLNTYTQLTKNIIAGATPMLNPPLVIPINNPKINGNKLTLTLSYKMGGDLESIKIK